MEAPRVILDHIKPHRPLLHPPVTRVTNHVTHMVQNNIRFCLSLQFKNRMVSRSFYPLCSTQDYHVRSYYTEMPFEKYGLWMSDYEWYLHTSRLKEIYRKQKRFIREMQRRQMGQDTFLEILQTGRQVEISAPDRLNPSGMPPAIYYVTPKADPVPAPAHNQTEQTLTTRETHTHTVHTEARVEAQTPEQSVNIDRIVKKVTEVLEDKWHTEQLRKGR